MNTDGFWRGFGKTVGALAGIPSGLVGGLVSKANGKTFEEGASNVFNAVESAGEAFGAKHGQKIESALVTTAAVGIAILGAKSLAGGKNPVDVAKESLKNKKS